MPHNITGVRVLAPPDENSHALVTRRGDVIRFSIAEPDYTVGRIRGEMLGFPGGVWVPASSAPGRLPEAVSYELTLAPRPAATLRQRTQALAEALPLAAELHRPDGRYLRVYNAEIDEYADGGDTITALFKPKSEVWRYPLLDDAFPEVLASVFETEQSTEGAPIYATTPGSRLVAPITAAKLPQGTMFVGLRTEAIGVYGIASLGAAVGPDGTPKPQALGMYKNNGTYVAHVGNTTVTALQDAAGGYGLLKALAMRWRENGLLSFYTFGANGFQDHGDVALGQIEPFALRQITLGTLSNFAGVDGFFMPGAPALGDFGVPFYTPRYWTEAEIEAGLGAQYIHYSGFGTLTILPPPFSLTLKIGEVPEAVVGTPVQIPLTVARQGGFIGDIEWEVETSDSSLRDGGVAQTEDNYILTLIPEEGINADTYSFKVTVRAVGQQTSAPLVAVIDVQMSELIVRLGNPALPENTTGFNAMAGWKAASDIVWAQNETASANGGDSATVQLAGLASPTSRYDGLRCDGTDTVWGKSHGWIDTNLEMGVDHSVSAMFWNVDKMPVNTVLMTLASRTAANKLHFWRVFKDNEGLRVTTSFGGSIVTSGQALPIVGGLMDVSVVRAENGLTLVNPKTEDSILTGFRNWVGLGRLTFFASKLADGTIQGLSKGVVLCTARQNRAVSTFQLERQAELMRAYVLRTQQWNIPEYPADTYAIFEANPGEYSRNRHPATKAQSLVAKGSGATGSGGILKTTGASEVGWRTPFITSSNGAKANDLVIVAKDISRGGSGAAAFGLSAYDDINTFIYVDTNSATGSDRKARLRLNNGADGSSSNAAPSNFGITGTRGYAVRLKPGSDRFELLDIASGALQGETRDVYTWSGPLSAQVGSVYRGLTSSGQIRGESVGLEFEQEAETLGFAMVGRTLSGTELADLVTLLTATRDYSTAPAPGAGLGGPSTPTAPGGGGGVTTAAGDVTAVAIAPGEWSMTTLFGSSGAMRTFADRVKAYMDTGGYGNQANQPIYSYKRTDKTYRGQYHVARVFSQSALTTDMGVRAFKNLTLVKQSQTMWNSVKAAFDTDTGAESDTPIAFRNGKGVRGHGYGTNPDGTQVRTDNKRIKLEAGVMMKSMVHALLMHRNKHLDSTLGTSANEMCDWYDFDHIPEWTAQNAGTSQATKPLHVKKNFTHANLSEIVGCYCRAQIRAGTNWAGDPLGVMALEAWALWYQSNTTIAIPVADFRYPEWASYGPARIWNQYAMGWNAVTGQFTQPVTYLNESWGSIVFLYLEGFLTSALGSQAAADTFMAECVSGANLGVFIEPYRATNKLSYYMSGVMPSTAHPAGISGPWMFITNPFSGSQTKTEDAFKGARGYMMLAAFDSSGRLTAIHDEQIAAKSGARTGTDTNYVSGNIQRLFSAVYRDGRKN